MLGPEAKNGHFLFADFAAHFIGQISDKAAYYSHNDN